MSKKNKRMKWLYISYLAMVLPILTLIVTAAINGAERSDILRSWGVFFVALMVICVLASAIAILRLEKTKKIIGVLALIVGLLIGYAVLYSYSFSFYGV